MADVPLAFTDWDRTFADLPAATLKNRFFEQNPTQAKGAAALARPGSDVLGSYGDGPLRQFYSLQGLFRSSLFFVSGDQLFRRETDGSTFAISGKIFGQYDDPDVYDGVAMTGVKGAGFEYLFIADGSHLHVYAGGTKALGGLTVTDQVTEGDTIQINETYYKWTSATNTAGEVEGGTGTVFDPWPVAIGSTAWESVINMAEAINFVGLPGQYWTTDLTGQNPDVTCIGYEEDTTGEIGMLIEAKTDLTEANSYALGVTSSDTVPSISWNAATMTGGGIHALYGVEMPDGAPPVDLTTLNSFVLIAVGDSDRFYWINPGETTLDALNFATAESHPDELVAIEAVGDTVWLIGNSSSEVWYATGNDAAPFSPVSGRAYPYGAIRGTVANVRNTLYFVGHDRVVYAMGGTPQRVSNHGVEEVVRKTLGDS